MSFVVQRVTARGLVLNQLGIAALRIGRGTAAELRSENPAVSLEHAVIEEDPAGFTVTDKGSITGTYVNGKPVESARLAKGDVIGIGDLRIEVQLAEAGRPMFLRVVSTARRAPAVGIEDEEEEDEEAPAAAQGGVLKAPKIDYVSALRLRRPYLTKASLIGLAAIVVLTAAGEIVKPANRTLFMPGEVSQAHGRATVNGELVAKNCSWCHAPWRGPIDTQCQRCHIGPPHSTLQAGNVSCTSCHPEHRGAEKLSTMSDAKCVDCHSDLSKHVIAGAVIPPEIVHIPEFGKRHPEFPPMAEGDTLHFEHATHLDPRGVRNAIGKFELLTCTTCHKLMADPRGCIDPKPIRFAEDCQRCHLLTFDKSLPNRQVPHGGDPNLNFVYGAIAAALSGQPEIATMTPEQRRILTQRGAVHLDERVNMEAEHVIKMSCEHCHLRDATGAAVIPPVIPRRWLLRADFAHTKHANIDCEKCHETARRSMRTTDVLIPGRDACVECHGSGKGKAADSCRTCHDYHGVKLVTAKAAMLAPPGGSGEDVGMIGSVLLAAIVLLLLVVLIPVGVATYQRLKPRDEEPPARRAAAPVPPLPATVKVPAVTAPPSSAPPATPAAPPPVAPAPAAPPPPPPRGHEPRDATRVVKLEEKPAAGGGSATEMVQWYGMLLCSSGPLEGQRFIVEDKGLYIGRDAALSDVVIPDLRVSKRHVRIVPRDGRVHAIDPDSTNGTFLASNPGVRITDVELKRGDVIVLGDGAASFTYQI